MHRVFIAEFAIFAKFNTIRIILFVFHRVVVSLLALHTRKRNFQSHLNCPPFKFDPTGPSFEIGSVRRLTKNSELYKKLLKY